MADAFDRDGNLGGFTVGCVLASFLSGLVWAQGLKYNEIYSKSRREIWMSKIVAVLLLVDLLSTILAAYSAYFFGVKHWGDLTALVYVPFSFSLNPMLVGFTTVVVQFFYAYRLWHISGNQLYLPVLIVIIALVQAGFAVGATYICFTHTIADFLPVYSFGVSTWLALACVGDFIIAGGITWYLRKARMLSNYTDTSNMITKIIYTTVETNGLTAIVALADAVLFSKSTSNWHVAINLPLLKLYIFSFLFALTSRPRRSLPTDEDDHQLANRSKKAAGGAGTNSNIVGGGAWGRDPTTATRLPIVVTMNVDRHEEVDEKDSWDVKRPSGRPSPTKAGSVEDC